MLCHFLEIIMARYAGILLLDEHEAEKYRATYGPNVHDSVKLDDKTEVFLDMPYSEAHGHEANYKEETEGVKHDQVYHFQPVISRRGSNMSKLTHYTIFMFIIEFAQTYARLRSWDNSIDIGNEHAYDREPSDEHYNFEAVFYYFAFSQAFKLLSE
jgi:hypothetical protein